MKKKLLCIALGFLLLSVAVAAFTLSGSADNVITIATAEELQKIGADAIMTDVPDKAVGVLKQP